MGAPALTPVEENIAFHMAIGMAVAQWAHVENGLFNLSALAFSKENWSALGAGFHAIENFRSKLAFTDQAVRQSSIFEAHLDEWAEARDLAKRLSAARNKIAHCRTMVFMNGKPGRTYAIVPISFDEPRFKSSRGAPPSGSLCVRDIDLISRQFSRSAAILFALYDRAGGAPHVASVPPEPRSRSLAQLRRQIELIHLQRAPASVA